MDSYTKESREYEQVTTGWRLVFSPAGSLYTVPVHERTKSISTFVTLAPRLRSSQSIHVDHLGALFLDSRYPTAANCSLRSGFCRGLLTFHSFGVWLTGGNRLYVRGRLLSSVALTQGGLDIFDGSKVWGLNECFQPWFMTMLVNVQLRLISFRVDPFWSEKRVEKRIGNRDDHVLKF